MDLPRLEFAPMEGITDHVYRTLHHRYFPGVVFLTNTKKKRRPRHPWDAAASAAVLFPYARPAVMMAIL